jgi:hypothetical protein
VAQRTALVALAVLAVLPACSTRSTPRLSASPSVLTGVAREALHPDPNYDMGLTVDITPAGFHPAWLVAPCCEPVTWRNQTGTAVSVVFDHLLVNSGPIPAGGTWLFKPPHAESIAYHAAENVALRAVVQVQQIVHP